MPSKHANRNVLFQQRHVEGRRGSSRKMGNKSTKDRLLKFTAFPSGRHSPVVDWKWQELTSETISPSVQLTPVCVDAGTWQELNGWKHHQLGLGAKTLASLGLLRAPFCDCCRNSQVLNVSHR